ncbi:MAG: hypothetical protein CSB44_03710 [Gammaproteobacteria bacterium]|nr:MAG: hypothetical protein CSB44_03710 [Gammaproteobacteria bacterium]
MPLPLLAGGAVISTLIVPLVVKLMVALGVGFVTYTGMTALLDQTFILIEQNLQGVPTEVAQLLALANIDRYVSIIASAYGAKLLLSGLNSAGGLTKFSIKGLAGG